MEKEILYRFFEGKASYQEEEAVCDWAETSDKNMQEYIRERKYFDMLLVRNKPDVPSRFLRGKTYALHNAVKYATAAAVILLCILQLHTLTQSNTDRKMNKISVPAGQRVNLLLSDGTNVWLNSGSKLEYPASFATGKENRKVVLNGEGYFEVAKNAGRSFIVQTKKYDIEVLGTKFNVNAYDNDTSHFSAALMEGSIQISDPSGLSRKVLIHPQQKADFINGQLVVENIRNYDIYRWKEGLLCFESIAFNDLMKEFEKTFGIRIINENKNLTQYTYSGKFRISDGIDYILHVLRQDVGFHFQRNENNTIIYIK